MPHHYHALRNEDGDLVRVLLTQDPQPPTPENVEQLVDASQMLSVTPIEPEALLASIDLPDLHHHMNETVLSCLLDDVDIGKFVDPQRDIDLAIRTGQPVLLTALLRELKPEDCPATFDHYGYRTMKAHHLGQSISHALDRALETQDVETLAILLKHDTVVRTLLDNLPGYQKIAASHPEMKRLFDRGLGFTETDPAGHEYRLRTLNHRASLSSSMDEVSRSALKEELKAITRSIDISAISLNSHELAQKIATLALALGMGSSESQTLPFANQPITLSNLIETHCHWDNQRRGSIERQNLAETLAILAADNSQRYQLTPEIIRHCRLQARDWLRFPLPAVTAESVKPIHLSLGATEADYASDKTVFERFAEQLCEIDSPHAKRTASFLLKADPDQVFERVRQLKKQPTPEPPLPLPHRLDYASKSTDCHANGPSL